MALLSILTFPDPRLRTVAQPVKTFDNQLLDLIDQVKAVMYASKGIGLAATQVNIHQRFFVMDLSEDQSEFYCLINPEIIQKEGLQYENEACLSVGGGAFDKIERAAKVIVRYDDVQGQSQTLAAEGLMAACIQHELDHLNGILFIDHLSRMKQDRIRTKIAKEKKRA